MRGRLVGGDVKEAVIDEDEDEDTLDARASASHLFQAALEMGRSLGNTFGGADDGRGGPSGMPQRAVGRSCGARAGLVLGRGCGACAGIGLAAFKPGGLCDSNTKHGGIGGLCLGNGMIKPGGKGTGFGKRGGTRTGGLFGVGDGGRRVRSNTTVHNGAIRFKADCDRRARIRNKSLEPKWLRKSVFERYMSFALSQPASPAHPNLAHGGPKCGSGLVWGMVRSGPVWSHARARGRPANPGQSAVIVQPSHSVFASASETIKPGKQVSVLIWFWQR